MKITAQQVQDKYTRDECAEFLTSEGYAVYDREDHACLAEALADHLNTEGITLDDLN
jgi:hypothetical protein